MNEALGMLETIGFTPAMVALDTMEKSASVRVLQAELNDFLGVCIKILGSEAAVQTAIAAGRQVAREMGGRPVVDVINRPDERAWSVIESRAEFNPLIQQDVVTLPKQPATKSSKVTSHSQETSSQHTELNVSEPSFALGFIETQGFIAVFEAIDSACKAANVEVVGKEKLGGGYVTVIVKGDVAAVKAAIEAGSSKVEGLGILIASHVIARPSQAVLSLLP